eukprot:Nk52_evm23s236 gene=Nk52_evmTU23s236
MTVLHKLLQGAGCVSYAVEENPYQAKVKRGGQGCRRTESADCKKGMPCIHPLNELYFCQHCSKLRCKHNLSQEIDSYYCSMCLETMPSSEARHYKNKCSRCFECPICSARLTVASSLKTSHFYFECGFCHWDSTICGLVEDKIDKLNAAAALGSCSRPSTVLDREMQEIMEEYKFRVMLMNMGRVSNLDESKVKELKSAVSSRTESLESLNKNQKLEVELSTSIAGDTHSWDISSFQQRLSVCGNDRTMARDLYPVPRPLSVKLSKRCRVCEHSVLKPELNPSSIKFKIRFSAQNYVPSLSFGTVPVLAVEQESVIALTITNPLEHDLDLHLSPLKRDEYLGTLCGLDTAEVKFPRGTISVGGYNEMAEYGLDADDMEGSLETKDVANVEDDDHIAFRKGNVISLYVRVKPLVYRKNVVFSGKLSYVVEQRHQSHDSSSMLLSVTFCCNLGAPVDTSDTK